MIKKEPRSRKFSFSGRPSVLEKAEQLAYLRRYSTNHLLNVIVEEYIEQHADELSKFNEVYQAEGGH